MAAGKHTHSRQYDIVVFGATGYTGQYTAEHIVAALPTDLNWAIAGRSREKLEKLAASLKALNPDRRQPEIEIATLDDASLTSLAKKTFILCATVGPYCQYGEHAFKACAQEGTHYLDVTGELPWVHEMIKKYEGAAKSSGALMFPQVGIESAPSDLMTWTLASLIRKELNAPTRDVTLSVHTLDAAPSGGTSATVLTIFDHYSKRELMQAFKPFALSPVPNPNAAKVKPPTSLLTRLTGLREVSGLGMLTTSFAGSTNVGIVQRSWGLLQQVPSRRSQSYGPNFSYAEYFRAQNWLRGIATHVAVTIGGLLLVLLPPVRALVRRFVYKPGQGKSREEAEREEIELRAVANPDLAGSGKQAFCRTRFRGSMYLLTAVLLAQSALTILEDYDGLELEGGVYTAACLGQGLIDRLNGAGYKFETKLYTA